jgi:homogentisate 1,2-dioxygenase
LAEILAKEEHGSKYLVNYDYLYGFSNEHQSECVPGALPLVQTNPQKVPLGLYAEQISGSAFVSEGRALLRSWVYRQQPSVQAPDFQNHASIKAWQTPGTATGNMFVDHPQTLR